MIAYTYLIGWSAHSKWYYGVRYARGCKPTDLWTTYFTSSNIVKAFREKHGEPDVVEVRRGFDCKEAAKTWEIRLLKRIKAVKHPGWLNANDTLHFSGEVTPEMIAKRAVGIKRGWDNTTPADKARRVEIRLAGWQKKFDAKSEEDKKAWRDSSAARLQEYNNGDPLLVRANAAKGARAQRAKIANMTPEEREEYDEKCAAAKRRGFASMGDDAREEWSEAKKAAWAGKTDDEMAAFKLLCADKRSAWHASVDPDKKAAMRLKMSEAAKRRCERAAAEKRLRMAGAENT